MVAGLLMGFAMLQVGLPLSRVISTNLLEIGQWHGLFLIDVALAVLSFGAINAVSLAPSPRQKAFSAGDLISFPLYAAGLALLCIVVSQGRLHWWRDADWLGVCLACAIGCIGLFVAVELRRSNPLLDLRWLASALHAALHRRGAAVSHHPVRAERGHRRADDGAGPEQRADAAALRAGRRRHDRWAS